MSNEPKFKMTLSVGLAGCGRKETLTLEDIGFTPEEWAEMTPEEKRKAADDAWSDWSSAYVDGGCEIIED